MQLSFPSTLKVHMAPNMEPCLMRMGVTYYITARWVRYAHDAYTGQQAQDSARLLS